MKADSGREKAREVFLGELEKIEIKGRSSG